MSAFTLSKLIKLSITLLLGKLLSFTVFTCFASLSLPSDIHQVLLYSLASQVHHKLLTSSLLLIQNATPETITQFHDQLSNELPTVKGKWSFGFKIYRNNPYSVPQELEGLETSPETRYLYTLSPSYIPDSTITLIDKKSVGVFPGYITEEMGDKECDVSIPDEHLRDGATTGLNDPFDSFLGSKLQSLWSQRQFIKGDGGQIYQLENDNLVIKTSNVTLHGNFRGLLIQIDLNKEVNATELKPTFEKICQTYNVPTGNLNCNVLNSGKFDKYGDLCLQYAEILNF